MTGSWIDRFDGLAALDGEARRRLAAAARPIHLSAGTRVFGPGQSPYSYILLLDGDIRVSQVGENGREIVLYRVQPGESCALTTACLLGSEDYRAEAVAETDAHAVAVPRAVFDDLMGTSAAFRRFVLTAFAHRITDLFKLVDEVAFQRMDMRLAHKLLELARDSTTLRLTHQQLAAELGTAREVVSRLMHELQRRGWVVAARGTIEITDRGALQHLAAGVG